jgi:hypothetical protein
MQTELKENAVPEEFEGDLAGAVFWGADLTGAMFRDVNLDDATITHASLINVSIDAAVDGLVINGVDVTAYVNERDPWYPLRTMLQPTTPSETRTAWSALEAEWTTTISTALALPDEVAHQSVGGEFSFVQTLRHVVFAMDKWFTAPVLGEPFHPTGLPNSGSMDFPWPGVDYTLAPSLTEALALRNARANAFGGYLESLDADDLTRTVEVLENGQHSIQDCVWSVLEEGFWHNRYARRDLALVDPAV